MRSVIFDYKNIKINFLSGESLSQCPENAICIDGIYQGPMIDPYTNRYSFDHHHPSIPRHAMSSSSKQIFDARIVGWEPPKRQDNKIWVYINDIDLDSMLAIFLLTIPNNIVYASKEWVEVVNGADVFGPAYAPTKRHVKIRNFLYHKVLRKQRGDNALRHITSILNALTKYFYQKNDYTINPKVSKIFVLEKTNFILPNKPDFDLFLLAIYSEDPIFEKAYQLGADIAVGIRRKGDKYKYSIAKRNDFVPYDLSQLVKLLETQEHGWGGGTSIIGSPENGSKIPPQELFHLIKRGEIVKINEKPKGFVDFHNEA